MFSDFRVRGYLQLIEASSCPGSLVERCGHTFLVRQAPTAIKLWFWDTPPACSYPAGAPIRQGLLGNGTINSWVAGSETPLAMHPSKPGQRARHPATLPRRGWRPPTGPPSACRRLQGTLPGASKASLELFTRIEAAP